MPYYKKWVCVELYVPIAVEAENEYQAKQEVINRIHWEGFPIKYDKKKDRVRRIETFPEDQDIFEISEEEYKSIKTKL